MRKPTHTPIARAILAMTGLLALASTPLHAQTADTAGENASPRSGVAAPAGENAGPPTVGELDAVTVTGSVGDLQSLDFYAPNSSAVISARDIENQGARKLDEALQYQAGVLSEPFGADNKVEWFKIRGFDASTSLDGTPTTPNGFFVWKPEIFGVESVEVLKGPNSLEFGASNTGGVVNLVTKRPRKEESLLMNLEAGHRKRLGLGIDYNGIANDAGNVYYRIVAQTRRADSMQRETDMKNYYLAPSLTVDFNERTSLTLLTSIQREDGRPTNGFLPGYGTIIDTPYGKIDRRLNAGEPDFDHLKRTQVSAGWLLTHKLNPDWTFTQNYRYSYLDIDQRNVFAYGSDNNRELLRGYSLTDGSTRNHYIDHRLKGRVRLGDSVEILPVVGVDYLKSDTSGRNNGFGMAPNLDMFDPVYGRPFTATADPYDLDTRQLGLYAAAQARVGSHWNFNAGIRHDRARSDGRIAGTRSDYDISHNSVNVGAMYISDYGVSPYVSYSESFRPQAGVDSRGNTYRPYVGKQKEAGIKFDPDWLQGTLTLAYFDIEERNALIADASNIQSQSGKRTNRGMELEGDFRITPRTGMKVAYTYNHSRQDIDGGLTIRTPLIPRHQVSLWVDHRFDLPQGGALTVGAGARYNGPTEDQRYYRGVTVPGYTLFDLMARYQIDRSWSLQLNARNLADKTYVSGCDFYCYYGGERTIDMQLQYQWR
ncbi:TonB-dependent siderophore receptor [uncultured Castellaniella sp.]|uniref:TonB-dependent siderophore receptor n=1 Tax=uncultured Castellaniella sp. TaxID=647907 RepID=UPI00261A4348|nr:TonB-dependent siderophore receptor [uncultured Castellaniella sp.]